MLIDSHAHLDAPYFQDKIEEVLERAREAGVKRVITVGVTPSSTRRCLELAATHPAVFPTAGYHPHWAGGADAERLAEAETLARHPAVAAIGEIGLDYHHFRSPKNDQLTLFGRMLDIAVQVGLPVVIHDRNAHQDVLALLSGIRSKLTGGVIHCFSGDWQLAKKYLDWGFFLSIPGTVTYSRSRDLREVAAKMPLDLMLLETDAPHLTPAPAKGQKNEPAFIAYTAQSVARIRGVSVDEIAEATSKNVYRAFRFDNTRS